MVIVREAVGAQFAGKPNRWPLRSTRGKVANGVWYNYRRVQPFSLIKELIDRGSSVASFTIGRSFSRTGRISRRSSTRRRRAVAARRRGRGQRRNRRSAGALHPTRALWLNGSIAEVTAMTETFIKERKHTLTGRIEPVGIDDATRVHGPLSERKSLGLFECDTASAADRQGA